MAGLHLYVWEDVLHDYTPGVMFALAPNVKAARELLLKECNYIVKEDLAKMPKRVNSPKGFVVWGGG